MFGDSTWNSQTLGYLLEYNLIAWRAASPKLLANSVLTASEMMASWGGRVPDDHPRETMPRHAHRPKFSAPTEHRLLRTQSPQPLQGRTLYPFLHLHVLRLWGPACSHLCGAGGPETAIEGCFLSVKTGSRLCLLLILPLAKDEDDLVGERRWCVRHNFVSVSLRGLKWTGIGEIWLGLLNV